MKLPKRAYWAVVFPPFCRFPPSLCRTKGAAMIRAGGDKNSIHRVRLVAVGAGERGK